MSKYGKKPVKKKKKHSLKGLALGTALYAGTLTGVNHLPLKEAKPTPRSHGTAIASGKLVIHVLDVGQGDAIFISCPDGKHDMLIDSGDIPGNFRYPGSSANFKKELQALLPAGSEIDYAVATHPHTDHIGNMEWVLKEYKVDNYIDNGFDYESKTYTDLMAAVTESGSTISYHSAQEGSAPPSIDLGTAVNVKILRPNGYQEESDDPNARSVVVRMDYGKTSFLFVGDCEDTEEALLEKDPLTSKFLNVDFLKVGHHGSDTSSSVPFLDLVKPKIAAISCGKEGIGTNKGYKHPRLSTLQNLEKFVGPRSGSPVTIDAFNAADKQWETFVLDKAIYETASEGELDFYSDGNKITFDTSQN
jgi:competence protein ComEC